MKILHVLHHSMPHVDGYSIRSKQIVDFQRSIGIDVRVLTSAQHEVEVDRPAGTNVEAEVIDGVVHHRTPMPAGALPRLSSRVPFARESTMMAALGRSLRRLLRTESIDLVHAHSPVLCGLPAVLVASGRGIPTVYEVRGFWEDGFTDRWSAGERSIRYRLSRRLETFVFRRASAVVAISQRMVDEIADRGIPRETLLAVPNGVDGQRFGPLPKDIEIVDRHALRGRPVLGFIGSFFHWEGLECLLDAMVRVRTRLPEARLVLVGGGDQEKLLPQWIRQLNLQDHVIVTGRVPHRDVMRYYSVMDVLVYPRLKSRITDLTPPLKPLEAMAMGKAVVGSDVGALRELLSDGKAGLLFKSGDDDDLAQRLVTLLTDSSAREQLAAAGREYVLREHAWERLVLRYQTLYLRLTERDGKSLREARRTTSDYIPHSNKNSNRIC
jgi:PEP-CTERM/exosortase A-associated glycosyltransferase